MARKLTIEVDAETSKAKAKIKKAVAEAGAGASSPSAAPAGAGADGLNKSIDKAARGLDEIGTKSKASASQIAGVVRSFAGLGVGMAANYATRYMQAGAARDAVQIGAGGLQGASIANAAAMAIPGGMIAKAVISMLGAGIGAAKVAVEQKAERAKATEEFDRGEKDYARAKDFKSYLDRLNQTAPGAMSNADKLASARSELDKYKAAEGGLVEKTRAYLAKGDSEKAQAQQGYLAENRNRQSQLESIIKGLETKRGTDLSREYFGGNDALSRVGGAFAGGGGPMEMTDRVLANKTDETNRLLREISSKAGGASWQ